MARCVASDTIALRTIALIPNAERACRAYSCRRAAAKADRRTRSGDRGGKKLIVEHARVTAAARR